MSSNSSGRNAAQRDRERRAAARAKRQAAKAASGETTPPPAADPAPDTVAARRPVAAPARREPKAVAPLPPAEADGVAMPLGDRQGDVATWAMLAVVFLLALLVVAVAAAS
ncbi:MAG: hypothetical protein ACTHMX_16170 [Thermomicrobiales bacterium]